MWGVGVWGTETERERERSWNHVTAKRLCSNWAGRTGGAKDFLLSSSQGSYRKCVKCVKHVINASQSYRVVAQNRILTV